MNLYWVEHVHLNVYLEIKTRSDGLRKMQWNKFALYVDCIKRSKLKTILLIVFYAANYAGLSKA